MRARQLFRKLRNGRAGVTAVEFGMLAPVMMLSLCGFIEVGYQAYMGSVLQGAVNAAARNSTLESANANITAIDDKVKDQVRNVSKGAVFDITRKSYSSFQDVGNPEPWNDDNGNGKRDTNECYQDINGNKAYDLDRGKTGQGGPDDIVRYTVKVTYPYIMPGKIFGWLVTNEVYGTTVLRNQPYGAQTIPTVVCAK